MPALPETEYFQTKGGVSDAPTGFLWHALGKRGPTGFGSSSVASQVVANWSGELNGAPKVFIITGASGGLGLESARVLASKGAEVILAVRNNAKGEQAVDQIKKEQPDAKASVMMLDVASLKSVREFVAQFKASGKALHGVILNAGVMFPPFSLSADGHEMQFATNHLGHFLLVTLLLDTMVHTATQAGIAGRIVSVSSMGHQLYKYPSDIRFDSLDSPEGYDAEKAYGQSKLCNILLARQLHAHLKGKPIIATACHPGLIMATDLSRHMSPMFRAVVNTGLFNWAFKSIPQGAATQVYLATAEGVEGGEYYVDCNPAPSSKASHSKQLATQLWELSERLCQ